MAPAIKASTSNTRASPRPGDGRAIERGRRRGDRASCLPPLRALRLAKCFIPFPLPRSTRCR
jgi:hypothetical protein